MSIQVIERREGESPVINTVGYGNPQLSYNSDKRLCIRYGGPRNDTLCVLDEWTSRAVIQFCQEVLRPINKPVKKDNDIPF